MLNVSIQKNIKQKNNQPFQLNISFKTTHKRTVIMGASGSGKSLTLKAIAGLFKPDTGLIQFNQQTLFSSQDHINLTPQQRHLAYVFQDYALFPHLTVKQNIAFSLSKNCFNPSKHIHNEEVHYWLSVLHLDSIANAYPAHISGGQRQRTALARALITKPHIILLDEPFSALDTQLRAAMREELLLWQQKLDLSLLLITHDPSDADALGEEIWIMDHGIIRPYH